MNEIGDILNWRKLFTESAGAILVSQFPMWGSLCKNSNFGWPRTNFKSRASYRFWSNIEASGECACSEYLSERLTHRNTVMILQIFRYVMDSGENLVIRNSIIFLHERISRKYCSKKSNPPIQFSTQCFKTFNFTVFRCHFKWLQRDSNANDNSNI